MRTHWHYAHWTIVDQCLASGCNFAVALILARRMGPQNFGAFTLGMMFIWFAQSINNALVYAPMLSIAPKLEHNALPPYFMSVLIHQALLMVVYLGLFWGVLAAAALFSVAAFPPAMAACLSVALVAVVGLDFLRRYFYACLRPASAAIASAVALVLQLLLVLVILPQQARTPEWALICIASANVVAALVVCGKLGPLVFQRTTLRTVTRRNWLLGRWLLVSILASWCCSNTFMLTAGAVVGPKAVGGLRAASLLIGIGSVLVQAIENFVPVHFSRSWVHQGQQAAWLFSARVAALTVGAVLLFSIVASLDPALWFGLIFGKDYLAFSWLVYAFALQFPLLVLLTNMACVLRALERSWDIFMTWIFMAAVTLVTVYPVVKLAGIGGAAFGIVAVQFIGVCVMAWRLWRARRLGEGAMRAPQTAPTVTYAEATP